MNTLVTSFAKFSLSVGVACCALSSFGAQSQVGNPAPKFTVTSMQGKEVFFEDMKTGGPIFIYFIRDGDATSQQETSYINEIIRAYGKSRTTWYGITNAQLDRARSYQAEVDPAFRLERDERLAAIKMLGVTSAPTVYEYDGNGKLMNVWKGFSAVNLKGINMANSAANHKRLRQLDFSKAPSTAMYGIDYNSATSTNG